jgi:hypothetical protein
MPERDGYRKRAMECAAAAELIRDPQERAALLEVAQAYLNMADHVGNRQRDASARRQECGERPSKGRAES